MPRYFAYGANLDRTAMACRCPSSRVLGTAVLPGYRFIVMAAGYATVVPDAIGAVHGLLWDLAPGDMPALDAFEEVERGLYRRVTLPILHGMTKVEALVYQAAQATPGVAQPGYMEAVIAAAEAAALPRPYRDALRTWLPRVERRADEPGG